jgi:hypothetical protein
MMRGLEFDRVVVVLVRARNPNNIGAVARAMHDFGFRHLRVVNEYAVPFESARSAVDASGVRRQRRSTMSRRQLQMHGMVGTRQRRERCSIRAHLVGNQRDDCEDWLERAGGSRCFWVRRLG